MVGNDLTALNKSTHKMATKNNVNKAGNYFLSVKNYTKRDLRLFLLMFAHFILILWCLVQ